MTKNHLTHSLTSPDLLQMPYLAGYAEVDVTGAEPLINGALLSSASSSNCTAKYYTTGGSP